MAKKAICDFCGTEVDMLHKAGSGWASIRCVLTGVTNYTMVSISYDICDNCVEKKFPATSENRKATFDEIIRELIDDSVQDAMEER
jgi:hypothetical protein